MECIHRHWLTRHQRPALEATIGKGGNQGGTLIAKAKGVDAVPRSKGKLGGLATQRPDPDRRVIAARGKSVAVGCDSETRDGRRVYSSSVKPLAALSSHPVSCLAQCRRALSANTNAILGAVWRQSRQTAPKNHSWVGVAPHTCAPKQA